MGSGQEMSAYVRSLGYSQEAGPDAFFQRLESTCRCFALLNTMQIGPQPNMFTGGDTSGLPELPLCMSDMPAASLSRPCLRFDHYCHHHNSPTHLPILSPTHALL